MNEPNDPVPPPDIPKPDLPPPNIPPPDLPKPEASAPPPPAAVAVKTRQPDDPEPVDPADTGIAPLNTRIVAAVLDSIVAVGLLFAVQLTFPGWWGMDEKLGKLVAMGYFLTRDCLPFLKGRSIGKTAMKLRAVTAAGEPLTNNWQAGILRNIALIIPFFGLVELIVLFTREDKPGRGRRLGDDWAKTKVIVETDEPEESED